jgi:hypothetical protein
MFDILCSDQAVFLGRVLFLLWCIVFTIAAGRPSPDLIRLKPRTADTVALCVPIVIALTSQLVRGQFTNYQAGQAAGNFGDTKIIIAISLGRNTLVFLPGLSLMLARRARTQGLIWLSRTIGVASVLLMLLTGGRSTIAFATGYAFLFARLTGMRFRLGVSVAAVLAVPLAFLFVFTYRIALSSADLEIASLSELTSIATNTASTLADGGKDRGQAVADFSANVRVRMGIGPQFNAVVESWLAKGPAFEGTFLDGLISVLPVYIFPDKNKLAVTHNFELALQRRGILPEIDLSPTPWMQWLYEFGVAGILIGATLSGRVVRFLERRIIHTQSTFEIVFWTYLLSAIYPAEMTIDAIFLVARDAGVLVTCGWLLAGLWRLATSVTSSRNAAPSSALAPKLGARRS